MSQNLSSAAVVIGALRAKHRPKYLLIQQLTNPVTSNCVLSLMLLTASIMVDILFLVLAIASRVSCCCGVIGEPELPSIPPSISTNKQKTTVRVNGTESQIPRF